ncbi:hypothetical protein G3I40_00545, partial [Streptomyces sp. SID14478]|nr:hypothetical protein [Streptomyces sp. SID14478]
MSTESAAAQDESGARPDAGPDTQAPAEAPTAEPDGASTAQADDTDGAS